MEFSSVGSRAGNGTVYITAATTRICTYRLDRGSDSYTRFVMFPERVGHDLYDARGCAVIYCSMQEV